jgi:NAD(P)H dehydrogenase (quinone)
MKILVVFYSSYGHTYKMAEAVVAGAREVEGAVVDLKRIPETLSDSILEKTGAKAAQKVFDHLPVVTVDELADYDAIVFGVPTRFGNVVSQVGAFLDATGGLWDKGALVGKLGSVFTSTATQHGGQETTIRALHTSLLHHGMVIAGLPYTFQGQMTLAEISGGSPYGASTIAGGKGERQPSENELAGARFQGRHVATLAARLARP